jgi:hypothetical protein
LGGNSSLEQGTGGRGAGARSVDQILESERNTMQRAAPVTALNLAFGLACLRQGGVGRHRNESVKPRIQFLDARQAFCCELDG